MKRLSTKLTAAYVSLFVVALTAVLGTAYFAVSHRAEQVVRDELKATATVFDRLWRVRTDQLGQGAELLARDFGFRAAVASHDEATLQSALANLRSRLGADEAFVLDPDGKIISQIGASGAVAPDAFRQLAQGERVDGVILVDGAPVQAVAAPILAPDEIGQVVFALRLDARELRSLSELSPIRLEPRVLVRSGAGPWRGSAALSPEEIAGVARLSGAAHAQRAFRVGSNVEVAMPLPSLGQDRAVLLLKYPLAEALAPYRGLLAIVVLLGLLGLAVVIAGSWILAREITRPVAALKQAAERLERGEAIPVPITGADEIAALGATFNRMADQIVRREHALEQARVEAERANRSKSQFLANMSHEIRTPLNGVLGMAQVMARTDLSPANGERLRLIHNSGQTLLAILNSILDLSKIEAGRLEIEFGDFDLGQAMSDACEPFAHLAAERGIAFEVTVDPSAEGTWRGDALRLRQVLSNLASNAVKFTEAGEVACRVAPAGETLRFEVRDTGVGIAPEHIAEIFDTFAQADGSSTRRFGGAGLGPFHLPRTRPAHGRRASGQFGTGARLVLHVRTGPAAHRRHRSSASGRLRGGRARPARTRR